MKKVIASIACLLAVLALGVADLRPLVAESCAASDSCCCGDPVSQAPCLCDDVPSPDFPELATFSGLVHPAGPAGEELLMGEIGALADLPPTWHPALPWHAPPGETRARLSVWIL